MQRTTYLLIGFCLIAKLWLNASYHTEVKDYAMVAIESYGKQLDWINGNKAILNYGIGFSDAITEQMELLAGVRMNNFANDNTLANAGQVRNTILDGNTLHLSMGTKLHSSRQTVVLGFDWGTLMDAPGAELLQQVPSLNRLGTDARDFRKTSINIFLTYGFVLERLRK